MALLVLSGWLLSGPAFVLSIRKWFTKQEFSHVWYVLSIVGFFLWFVYAEQTHRTFYVYFFAALFALRTLGAELEDWLNGKD